MMPQLVLNKQHLADFKCIREIGQAGLARVVTEVKNLSVEPIHPRDLERVISEALDGNEANAKVVLRQLLLLCGLLRELGLSQEEVFAGLDSGLQQSGLDEDELKKWVSVSGTFKELFELPIVRLVDKVLDLSYQHSHLLQRARIITDIRPLFNDNATEIQGTVISHKFLLRYSDIEGEHEISFAVDEKDIELLINQCERALIKSQTTKDQLNEKAGLKSLIPGKDEND